MHGLLPSRTPPAALTSAKHGRAGTAAYNTPVEGTRHRLLQSLDRRGFRSGTEIGALLGLSRAAVHKHVQALVERGVPIHRVPGRGYRLAEGVTLLAEGAIAGRLSEKAGGLIDAIEVLDEIDSTTAYLFRRAAPGSLNGRVCLAERQTAGRGRRGRSWVASPYRDLMMSIGIEYPQWPAELPALGLVTALTVAGALQDLEVRDLKVKWPNDVTHEDRKLCGVLLDVAGEAHGACRIVVGIGINVSMSDEQAAAIDQPWVDLETLARAVPDRNAVAAACLNALMPMFASFPGGGFAAHRSEWRRLDALQDRAVSVHCADGSVQEGEAAGVDGSGRLRVIDSSGETRLLTQGDVKVRAR